MSGLMEQLKVENKHVYDVKMFPLNAAKMLAENVAHHAIQAGKLLVGDYVKLKPLLESNDLESIYLAISLIESKSDIKYTKD